MLLFGGKYKNKLKTKSVEQLLEKHIKTNLLHLLLIVAFGITDKSLAVHFVQILLCFSY